MSTVSIVKTSGGSQADITAAVRKAVAAIGGLSDVVKAGNTVLIKPNLVALPPQRLNGAITRYEICLAICEMVKELGARPVVAESSAVGVDTEKVIAFGEYSRLRELGYEVLDLKREKTASIATTGGKIVQELTTWEIVANADVIISVPVMKTHDQTEVTLSIKNLKGLINDSQKKTFHSLGVLEGVVDILETLKPQLTVIDGTVAQEGLGPIFGDPVQMGLVIASKDLVAADAVTSTVMGYDAEDVLITKLAAGRGLGEMDIAKIEVIGEPVASVRRRFKRSCEVEIEGVPPFQLLFDKGACTGCRNTVLSAIMDMKKAQQEGHLAGKTIIAGPLAEVPSGLAAEDVVLVGKCANHLKGCGRTVAGCPPNNSWVVQGVVGDAGEPVNRYATEKTTKE